MPTPHFCVGFKFRPVILSTVCIIVCHSQVEPVEKVELIAAHKTVAVLAVEHTAAFPV
jgi:hypothetical protein